jgi:hypothetical protein
MAAMAVFRPRKVFIEENLKPEALPDALGVLGGSPVCTSDL